MNIQKQVTRKVEFKPNKVVANKQVKTPRAKPRNNTGGLHNIINQDLFSGVQPQPRTPSTQIGYPKHSVQESIGSNTGRDHLNVPTPIPSRQSPNKKLYKNTPSNAGIRGYPNKYFLF